MESSQQAYTKAKLTEVNSYLTCYLCKGYYIDATTIVECLHSFCRSCIIRHLQQKSYCPVCELMINTAKPNIKLDKTLQDIVYKLVPGLYASEMCRRRIFWARYPEATQKVACPEARGQTTERIIFSPQDAISLSIEYTSDDLPDWNQNNPIADKKQHLGVPLRRYLQCPAMLRVEHLKKFIYNKYNIESQQFHVDILHKRVPLPDHYTLMDIAYIYSWKRNEPMKFFFRITDINLVSERFDYFEPSAAIIEDNNIPTPVRCRGNNKHHNTDKSTSNNQPAVKDINKANSAKVKIIKNDFGKKSEAVKVNQNGIKVRSDLKSKVNADLINDVTTEVKSDVNNTKVNTDVQLNHVDCVNKENNSEIRKVIEDVKLNEVSENFAPDSKVNKSSKASESKVPNIISAKTFSKIVKKPAAKTGFIPVNIIPKPTPQTSSNQSSLPNSQVALISKSSNTAKITKFAAEFTEEKQPFKMPKPEPNNGHKVPDVLSENPDEQFDKTQFLNSIQLTPRTSPTSPAAAVAAKIRKPEITKAVFPSQKRKYVFKTDKALAKKSKMEVKLRKILPKGNLKSAADLKTKNIKDPIVRLMVSNMNKQASDLTKIVGQADVSPPNNVAIIGAPATNVANLNLGNFGQIQSRFNMNMTKYDQSETILCINDQNEKLQSLIDSCKINIPSSLSITLTESTRGEDGLLETKPTSIKPVQNYIEILKLPESNTPKCASDQSVKSPDSIVDTPKKSDMLKSDTDSKSALLAAAAQSKNQKQTFQTMFEEAIKRNESMRAHFFHIQSQAKMSKKQTNANPLKLVRKQQSNALDLSTTSSNSESSNSPTPMSGSQTKVTTEHQHGNDINTVKSPKRNILEIAHQLSKRSKLDADVTVPKLEQPAPKTETPETAPKKIIINNNFSSGGSISIKDTPNTSKNAVNTIKTTPTLVPKVLIPRLPIAKVPTLKLNPPNIRNGSLVKVGTYSPKAAANVAVKNDKASPPKSPSKPESTQQLLSPNQLLEKYKIGNLAQLNANLNQAQLAFQQAVMMSHQIEMQRIQQINNQKHSMLTNPNILAHYENYVQSLKNQQNICSSQSNNN